MPGVWWRLSSIPAFVTSLATVMIALSIYHLIVSNVLLRVCDIQYTIIVIWQTHLNDISDWICFLKAFSFVIRSISQPNYPYYLVSSISFCAHSVLLPRLSIMPIKFCYGETCARIWIRAWPCEGNGYDRTWADILVGHE